MRNQLNVRKNILRLVSAFPEVKENYNALVSAYWILFDGVTDINQIDKATPAETITRYFRMLVSQGEISVPERVMNKRKERELEFRTEFSALA